MTSCGEALLEVGEQLGALASDVVAQASYFLQQLLSYIWESQNGTGSIERRVEIHRADQGLQLRLHPFGFLHTFADHSEDSHTLVT